MVIRSIGVDIEEITRFSKISFKTRQSFYKRIFTKNEIKYCLSKSNPYPHFAVRFCAKEAAIKALKNKKIKFSDIEVSIKNDKPVLNLPDGKKSMVSLSHTKKYAMAFVILL